MVSILVLIKEEKTPPTAAEKLIDQNSGTLEISSGYR
jgi:hypothetical protein